MGWALSDVAVKTAGDPATELSFHERGFDSFDANLAGARSASFGEWAGLAGVASNGSSTPVAAVPPATGSGTAKKGDEEEEEEEDDDDDD